MLLNARQLLLIALLGFALLQPAAAEGLQKASFNLSASHWLLVDTDKNTLTVFRGKEKVDFFPHIAIGRGGAKDKEKRGDKRTPRGEFSIAWVNWDSSFHIFLGIDYPNIDHAERGLKQGLIDMDTYQNILSAYRSGRLPPQNTPLGGNIGIHGLGRGDPRIHEDFNWTQGCVALTNREIERLAHWVDIGTRVVIR